MIMDGNTRWAAKNKVTQKKGYLKGFDKIIEITDLCMENKIKYLTLFALSTENYKRTSVKVIFNIIPYNTAFVIQIPSFIYNIYLDNNLFVKFFFLFFIIVIYKFFIIFI